MKLAGILVTVTIAHADMAPIPKPKARPVAKAVPTRAIACLPDAPVLRTSDGSDVVACWSAGCAKLDLAAGTAIVAQEPREQAPFTVTASASVPDICLDNQDKSVCKKAGKKLEELVFKELKRPRMPNDPPGLGAPEATTDLKLVLLDGLYSVPQDRPLVPTPPRGMAKAAIEGFTVAGKLVVVDWVGGVAQVVDSSGSNRGGMLASGDVRELDSKRFVIVSRRSSLQVIDANSGKLLGATTPSATDDFASSIRLAGGVAIARRTGQGFVVERFTLSGDTPQRADAMTLPKCTP